MDKKQYSEEIKKFYTEQTVVWPENDKWHMHTHCYINDYVSDKINSIYKKNMKILNAGSGGNTYGLTQEMYHIDVADNKIKHFPLYSKASIEDIPYNNEFFDICICVGTVINYTNASRSMDEFYRVLKPGGSLVLEFENSGNPEFRKYPCDEAGKK
ncbi:MAG: class I SAM-dependent methyltransferase, partial [Oscillospiraceae bacterium]|nr:class I SAM-dependent methyltransferase [Oscillospiraceae bacterium]